MLNVFSSGFDHFFLLVKEVFWPETVLSVPRVRFGKRHIRRDRSTQRDQIPKCSVILGSSYSPPPTQVWRLPAAIFTYPHILETVVTWTHWHKTGTFDVAPP